MHIFAYMPFTEKTYGSIHARTVRDSVAVPWGASTTWHKGHPDHGGNIMSHFLKLEDADFGEIQMIVMDKDKEAALMYLKEKIFKPMEQSARQSPDQSKGGSLLSR